MPERSASKTGATAYRCLTCSKTFSSNSHLRRHEAVHSRDRLNRCAFCNRAFVRHDVLRRHSKSCPQRGKNDAIASARPGRRPRAEESCRPRRTRCDGSGSCKDCSGGYAQCFPYSAHDIDHSTARPSPNCTSDNDRGSASSDEDDHEFQPYPISFLFHYTDPFRESVVNAFTVVGAHAHPPNTQEYQYTDNQLFEGDMAGLFGVFSDLFMEPGVDPSVTRPPTATAPPQMLPALQTRADDLRSQLFSQHKKCQTTSSFPGGDFPMDSAKVVFTANNFDDCVWAYFTFFHPQHPFIHWPTFDVNKVSLPLLLSVVFTGSVHCTPTDAAWSTRFFFDLGEDLIFEQLRNVVAKNDRHDDCVLQIVQACLLIIASQISFNDEAVRRRIRISRHPELVASIRSLELTKPICKSSLDVSEWRMFITEESRVRSIHIMFLMDCMSTFFFNTLPQMAVSEMHQHLPCNDELFEASTPEEFARLSIKSPRSADGTPSIKQLVSWLMSEDWSGPDDPIFDVIESRHLMICIFALHSIIFVSRAALLVSSSYRLLLRALSRWKEIWDAWYARRDAEQKKAIGFTKYGVELWWVARKVLELAHVGDIHSRYMAGTPTDSVRELHEFIEKYAKYKDT